MEEIKLSNEELEVIDEARANRGYIEFDMNNPTHAAYFIGKMGGKAFAEKNYPLLMEAVNVKKNDIKVQSINSKDALNFSYIESGAVSKDTKGVSFSTATQIKKINNVRMLSSVLNVEQITGNNRVLPVSRESRAGTNTNSQRIVTAGYLPDKSTNVAKLAASSLSVFSVPKIGGASISLGVTEELNVRTDGNNPVKSFNVLSPVGKKSDNITVSYLRNHMITNPDYSYNNSPVNGNLYLLLPIKIEFELLCGYSIRGVSKRRGMKVFFEPPNGGILSHMGTDRHSLLLSSKNNGTVNHGILELPYDWNNYLNFSQLENKASVDLNMYAEFNIDICPYGKPNEFSEIPFVFNTRPDIINLTNKMIPRIWLQWGCMGKDTVIKTSEGNKRISEITTDDSIISPDGNCYSIKDIHYGYEEYIRMVKTEEGTEILLTPQHTVRTTIGNMPVSQLKEGDYLCSSLGDQKVSKIEKIQYKDTVYNLEFAQPTILYGNDIFVGDFIMQQTVTERPDSTIKAFSKTEKELQAEIAMLMNRLMTKDIMPVK